MESEGDLLELFAKYKDMELRFKGKPDDVIRSLLKFIHQVIPTYDLASNLILTVDLEELLKNYQRLKEENEKLRRELVTCKASNEAKDAQIQKLQEEIHLKDLELEEIVEKVEKILGQ